MTKFDPMGRPAPRTGRPQGRGSAGSYLVGLLCRAAGKFTCQQQQFGPARCKYPEL